jgi:YHS domain-containing protein
MIQQMRLASWCLVLVVGGYATLARAQDAKAPEAPQGLEAVKCPLCPGMKANLAVSLTTDDGPVFFCGKSCLEGYQKDTAKYADKVAAQRTALAALPKVQVLCPVEKTTVSLKSSLTKDGATIYFCCDDCKAKYEAEPAKYKANLANSYTYQVKCPVMSKPITPKWSIKLEGGETVYFCCGRCPGPYAKDPERYAPGLTAQGLAFASFKPAEDKEAKPTP